MHFRSLQYYDSLLLLGTCYLDCHYLCHGSWCADIAALCGQISLIKDVCGDLWQWLSS